MQLGANGSAEATYDPFAMSSLTQNVATPQYNPYLEDPNASAAAGGAYFPAQSSYTAPTQPVG